MIIEILAKLFRVKVITMDDCPFVPTSVDGKPVLIAHKNKLIVGA